MTTLDGDEAVVASGAVATQHQKVSYAQILKVNKLVFKLCA